MKRGKKIIVMAHCLLNANAIVLPEAGYSGVLAHVVGPYIEQGAGLLQLPCPETSYLGMRRFGMTVEQYDSPGYRLHCRRILEVPFLEIRSFLEAGYEVAEALGVAGSPSCGVLTTCKGFSGGSPADASEAHVAMVPGRGIFMQEFARLMGELGLSLALGEVDNSGREE